MQTHQRRKNRNQNVHIERSAVKCHRQDDTKSHADARLFYLFRHFIFACADNVKSHNNFVRLQMDKWNVVSLVERHTLHIVSMQCTAFAMGIAQQNFCGKKKVDENACLLLVPNSDHLMMIFLWKLILIVIECRQVVIFVFYCALRCTRQCCCFDNVNEHRK